MRITAQLIRADDGTHLWAENYDRELTDIFAIQEEIAQAIAASLRVPLGLQQGETLVRSRTKDDASYEDYLRAKALVRARGGNGTHRGRQAAGTGRRPRSRFCPRLGASRARLRSHPELPPGVAERRDRTGAPIVEASLPKAEAAAQRAIQLDPKNPDGYVALGLVQEARGKWLAAGDLFSRALALDPDNPDALHFYSYMLAGLGYVKQALPMRQRLQALEPFVPVFALDTARFMAATVKRTRPSRCSKLPSTTAAVLRLNLRRTGRYSEAADALLTIPAGSYLPGTVEAAARLLRTAPAVTASPQTLPRLGIGICVPLCRRARSRPGFRMKTISKSATYGR